jgi:hypothetical protein
MEDSQKDIVDLLKIVSNQTPRIENLETQAERMYKEVGVLYDRVRDVEMTVAESGPTVRQQFHEAIDAVGAKIDFLTGKLDKVNSFIKTLTCRYALYAYGAVLVMITTGTLLDFMYHLDMLKSIYHFFKG